TIDKQLRFSRGEIITFAHLSHDDNPLHQDAQAAQRARFGEIIASGQHSASVLMGALATHFSRQDDGLRREMLCLNMNFAFKEPVFADQDLRLHWRVASVEWKSRLGGALAQLDGTLSVAHARPSVISRATILIKEAVDAVGGRVVIRSNQ
ncbi:MAG TPA: MaoC family dehydratase, partial [Rubrivivax sp.]|nr:MaoC family dehydratase [Rubrivivax sp.]